MARVAIGAQVDTYEVDLWGTLYEAKPATRTVAIRGKELVEQLTETEDQDEAVKLYGQILDLRLSPANGKRTKASAVIDRQWQGDKVTISQLDQLIEDLAEADRPT